MSSLSLQHFVLRAEARKLYREALRSVRGAERGTAEGVRRQARAQFELHSAERDPEKIRCLLVDGRHMLEQMRASLATAKRV